MLVLASEAFRKNRAFITDRASISIFTVAVHRRPQAASRRSDAAATDSSWSAAFQYQQTAVLMSRSIPSPAS
jgi:hypothetical protein